ncbi:ribose-phosphate pyrophosphokinase [Fonticula alba]|uniref:ribose-phosphate diphosphokinase n=1 Tax=Fonticula alba TaxID=691883 RepID=A0A058Z098_FONAL|nr:ribose-phosphate pyrophosphokinase [Fonticula alba]KCV67680.1 ribose-phosphate pyrophosphokinase [Fonticula alba]|eukprot:XP_009497864.1 ribose-phosphate pyrophosphokinase [Fonticula alba]
MSPQRTRAHGAPQPSGPRFPLAQAPNHALRGPPTGSEPGVLLAVLPLLRAGPINESVRGEDVYIVQTGKGAVNDHIMELVIMISACKMASSRRVTAVIPYMPYSKQSKKKRRNCVVARLFANMLRVAGVDHVMTMDLHHSQIQGFFSVPVDNLVAEPSIAEYIRNNVADWRNAVVVAKNPGATKRVTSLADCLGIEFALVHTFESRARGKDGAKKKEYALVGDVSDKIVFILDDHIDKCKAFISAAHTVLKQGATRVYIVATHGILSGDSLETLEEEDAIHEVIITNTVPISLRPDTKVRVIDVSDTFGEAIRRTHNGESISYLFSHTPEELYQ